MVNRKDNILGVVLILAGLCILLLNTDILPKGILLFLVGLAFLIWNYRKESLGKLVIGLTLLAVGIGSTLDEFGFVSADLSGFFFMWSLGIVFLVLYFTKNIKGFLYTGCILPSIGTYVLLDNIYGNDIGWVFFLLISISFFAIYLIEHRRTENNWSLIPGIVLFVISVLFFTASEDIIDNGFWQILSYIWPSIIILIGIRLVYINYKHKG